jgi:hypothetical protein
MGQTTGTFCSPNFAVVSGATDLVAVGGAPCRALRATAAGNIVVISEDGQSVTLPFLAGEMQPVRCKNISSLTTTSATVYW